MKFNTLVPAALVSLGLLTAASAEDAVKFKVPGVTPPTADAAKPPASAPAAAPAKPAAKYTEAQVLEAFGWVAGQQLGLRQLEFTKEEVEIVARGMIAMASGTQPAFDPAAMEPELKAFMAKKAEAFEAKRQAFLTKLRMQNITDNIAYFTKLKENKGIVELPSGLRYEVLKPATGAAAKIGQVATIHYSLSLVNGQSLGGTAGGEPIELIMKAATPENPNGTIAGMVEGLTKIGVGGKARLHIPPSLAYGDDGYQGIPPGAALIFEIEVVGVKDAPKEAAAAGK
ncbi:MAG: FKBP-type peptidyl-prolyl cis-trans isomerase [Opitutae bacterium]|nr:FKBP-type peptidyl-prolyl cis-trans isomerase [Opitutae bacterium]